MSLQNIKDRLSALLGTDFIDGGYCLSLGPSVTPDVIKLLGEYQNQNLENSKPTKVSMNDSSHYQNASAAAWVEYNPLKNSSGTFYVTVCHGSLNRTATPSTVFIPWADESLYGKHHDYLNYILSEKSPWWSILKDADKVSDEEGRTIAVTPKNSSVKGLCLNQNFAIAARQALDSNFPFHHRERFEAAAAELGVSLSPLDVYFLGYLFLTQESTFGPDKVSFCESAAISGGHKFITLASGDLSLLVYQRPVEPVSRGQSNSLWNTRGPKHSLTELVKKAQHESVSIRNSFGSARIADVYSFTTAVEVWEKYKSINGWSSAFKEVFA